MSDRERDELLAILGMIECRHEHDAGLAEDDCHRPRSPKLAAWAAEQRAVIQWAIDREKRMLGDLERDLDERP